jgi:hypothetical protein
MKVYYRVCDKKSKKAQSAKRKEKNYSIKRKTKKF